MRRVVSVVQYLERSLLLLVTSASDLPVRTIYCLRRNIKAFCKQDLPLRQQTPPQTDPVVFVDRGRRTTLSLSKY